MKVDNVDYYIPLIGGTLVPVIRGRVRCDLSVRQPTQGMIDAGVAELAGYDWEVDRAADVVRRVYLAMVAESRSQ